MTSVKTVTLSSQSWISRDLNFFFIQSCSCELPFSYLRLQEEGEEDHGWIDVRDSSERISELFYQLA